MKLEELEQMTDDELKKLKSQVDKIISDRERISIKPAKLDAYTLFSKMKERLSIELKIELLNADLTGLSLDYIKKTDKVAYKQIGKVTEMLNKYLQSLLDRNPTSGEKIRWYVLYTELCAENLIKINVPLSIRSLAYQCDSFPSLLNKAFPGYIKAGVVSKIVEDEDETYM